MGLENPKTAEPVYSNHVPARKRKENPLICGVLIFDHDITFSTCTCILILAMSESLRESKIDFSNKHS